MKNLLLLLLTFFTINSFAQDSLDIKLDVVEKGYYMVFKDSIKISQHTKPMKASAKAMELQVLFPNSLIYVQQPNLEPRTTLIIPINNNPELQVIIDEQSVAISTKDSMITAQNSEIDELTTSNGLLTVSNAELQSEVTMLADSLVLVKDYIEANIYYTPTVGIKTQIIDKPIPDMEFGNGCSSPDSLYRLVSYKPFDFKDVPVRLNSAQWHIKDSLLNNGVQIDVIKALADSLIITKCLTDKIIYEGPVVPVDTNLINNLTTQMGGWDTQPDGSFRYNATTGSYKYIVWNLHETLLVGETYKITFDIINEGTSLFKLWLYVDSVDGYNGGITGDMNVVDGQYEQIYTVVDHDRVRFGIRARNNSGDAFTVSNIKIEKIIE